MAGLPKTLTYHEGGVTFQLIHGGVDVVNRFVFAPDHDRIAAELARADADVIVAGHCGLPFIEMAGSRVWFNPGVIGMPANDGTPDGWYGLIKVDGRRLALATRRLAYDFTAAARAMFRMHPPTTTRMRSRAAFGQALIFYRRRNGRLRATRSRRVRDGSTLVAEFCRVGRMPRSRRPERACVHATRFVVGRYCWGVKPEALMAGAHSSESAFWILASSSGDVPVA